MKMGVKSMNTKRIFGAAVVITIFGMIWTMVTCAGLFGWVYEIPPIIWKDASEMMTLTNTILSIVWGFLTAILFTLMYAVLYKGIPGKGVKKGIIYGFIVYLIGTFSGIVGMPLYMTISPVVVVYWVLNYLVSSIIMGAIVGAIYKPK